MTFKRLTTLPAAQAQPVIQSLCACSRDFERTGGLEPMSHSIRA